MSFDPELFDRISILMDGNCFFRCACAFMNKTLLHAVRYNNGKIKNREHAIRESSNSKALREFICHIVSKEKHKYIDSIYYDDDHYKNIDDRIECMNKLGEFESCI